jgi:hypothetical protein
VHNRGRVFRVALALVAVVTLAGCSSALPTSNTAGLGASGGATIAREALPQDSAAAQVGQCWSLTYEQFHEQPENAGGSPVDCSTPHQAYTFAVETMGVDDQRSDVSGVVLSNCADQLDDLIPSRDAAARVYVSAILPTDAQWATGDRASSCLVMATKIGSLFRSPIFIDLPAFSQFRADVNAAPNAYYACVNDPGTTSTTGPSLGLETVLASCDTAQWTLEPSPEFPDPAGEAYPGYSGLYPFMHAHCGAIYDTATRRGWDFYPSEQQWDEGSRDFSCWTGAR